MIYLKIKENKVVELPVIGKAPKQVHVFEQTSVDAVNAAIAAKRPLLVRGEPGTGKTQLARAAAMAMEWAFVTCVIDSRSEASDLLYTLDAVTRLGEAQITAALNMDNEAKVRALLAEENFISPGPVWWAFDWDSAKKQADKVNIELPHLQDGGNPKKGCVLLIDEIDKADSDLPNGLLAAFGSGYFQVPGIKQPVLRNDTPLLVIITTNEERALPDAFLRRCLVLHLEFPKDTELLDFFVKRGRAHFNEVDNEVLKEAAQQVYNDRKAWLEMDLPAPGLAEYLDLIRAIVDQETDTAKQLALLHRIKNFVLKKHPEA